MQHILPYLGVTHVYIYTYIRSNIVIYRLQVSTFLGVYIYNSISKYKQPMQTLQWLAVHGTFQGCLQVPLAD